jgi:hypothetical protein
LKLTLELRVGAHLGIGFLQLLKGGHHHLRDEFAPELAKVP